MTRPIPTRTSRRACGRPLHLIAIPVLLLLAASAARSGADNCATTKKSWEGLSANIVSPANNIAHPPDVHGAAGPSGVLAVTNSSTSNGTTTGRIRYFDKNGVAVWSDSLRGFFTMGSGGGVFDPKAIYDPGTSRFFVTITQNTIVGGQPRAFLYVGVSKTSNPTTKDATSWDKRKLTINVFTSDCQYVADYPGIGVDGQALYLTYNTAMGFGTCEDQASAQFLCINKSSLITPPVTFTQFVTPTGMDRVPVSVLGTHSPGDTAYFVQSSSPTSITLWAIPHPLQQSSVPVSTSITIPDCSGVGTSEQPAGCSRLDTRAGILQGNAFWHDGSLWTCQAGGAGGSSSAPTRIHYYRIATNGFPAGTPSLAESGTILGLGGASAFAPAIGGNANGDVAIVFNQGSASPDSFVSIYFTMKQATESAFHPPALLKRSASCYSGIDTRWGDYGTVSADPSDQSFWFAHEWAKASATRNWGTWWGNAQPAVLPAITDVSGSSGRTSIAVSWTEPSGNPCSFDVRYSSAPITEQNFYGATPLSPPSPLGIPGYPHCVLVAPLTLCSTYYFAIKSTFDGRGVSAISNAPAISTVCSGWIEAECNTPESATRLPAEASAGPSTRILGLDPNPARGPMKIRLEVGARDAGLPMDLSVYDLIGRRVRRLVTGRASPGAITPTWDLAGSDGDRIRTGVYFVRLRVGSVTQTRTLCVIP